MGFLHRLCGLVLPYVWYFCFTVDWSRETSVRTESWRNRIAEQLSLTRVIGSRGLDLWTGWRGICSLAAARFIHRLYKTKIAPDFVRESNRYHLKTKTKHTKFSNSQSLVKWAAQRVNVTPPVPTSWVLQPARPPWSHFDNGVSNTICDNPEERK
jgi:hypothetical protein